MLWWTLFQCHPYFFIIICPAIKIYMFSTLKDSKILEEPNARKHFLLWLHKSLIKSIYQFYLFMYNSNITGMPLNNAVHVQKVTWSTMWLTFDIIMRIRQIALLTYLQDVWLLSLSLEENLKNIIWKVLFLGISCFLHSLLVNFGISRLSKFWMDITWMCIFYGFYCS